VEFPSRTCDVLIIGAGCAGLTTALELARADVPDVVVVEQGPFAGFAHESLSRDPLAAPDPVITWSSPRPAYVPVPGVAGAVGGRSRSWYGVVVPIDVDLLRRRWPHQVVTTLLGDGPGSYASALEDLARWRGCPLDARQSASDEPIRDALNAVWTDTPVGVVPQAARTRYTTDSRSWEAYSPLLSWGGTGLPRYHSAALPPIVYGMQAEALLIDRGGRPTGVVLRGSAGRVSISAGTVVLAAGTLENTRLYAGALAALGHPQSHWPGLNDHIPHGFVAPLPPTLKAAWTAPDRAFLWAPHDAMLLANLFVDVHTYGLPEPVLDLWWLAQQEEPFLDAVDFAAPSSGDTGARIVSALRPLDHLAMDRRDAVLGDLLAALDIVEEPVERADLADLYQAVPRALGNRHAVRYVNPLGTSDHEAGTIPLGAHLDQGGRVPWSSRLFVTGPATFPTPGAANPTLTIMALAAQTAAAIVT